MVEEAIFIKEEDAIDLKKALAKKLYLKKFDQVKISRILKISQPMVSNYCNSKEIIPDNILNKAEKISNIVLNGNSFFFNICINFDEKPLEGSYFIAEKNEVLNNENNLIIENLTKAFFMLEGMNISKFLPEVKINIAMANENAKSPDDVGAFLNGLVIVDDKVVGNNGIRFGKSKHLSSLLLYLKKNIKAKAIMNIAFIESIKKTSFNFSYLTTDFKLVNNKKDIDILLHKGDFGIEPCAYIIGKNAVEVVNKILKIKDELS